MGRLLVHLVLVTLASILVSQAWCQALSAPKLTGSQAKLCKTGDLKQLAQDLKVKGPADKVGAAAELYIWGLPLLPMAKAMQSSGVGQNAINRLNNIPFLLDPKTQFGPNIVASNSDTLYGTSWLDLSKGPVVLKSGPSDGRFYTMELLDFYTEVFGNPGYATTGPAASTFVVSRCPVDKSKLPTALQSNVTAYLCSNTDVVWMIARTYVTGQSDLDAARKVQTSMQIQPMDAQGKALSVPPAASTQVASLSNTANDVISKAGWEINSVSNAPLMFSAILGLAKAFPPQAATSGPLKLAPSLGLDPSKGFNQPSLTAEQQAVLDSGYLVGQACVNAYTDLQLAGLPLKYGWGFFNVGGVWGTNYLNRAVGAIAGLGVNWPNITIYPTTLVDKDGKQLTGAGDATYTWTIDEASLPPAKYFSSLVIYNLTNKMFPVVPGAPRWRINYPADKGEFVPNSDGSSTFWLSYKPPGPKDSKEYKNWLPLSDGPSWAMLRMYGPSADAIAGHYQPPPFVRIK